MSSIHGLLSEVRPNLEIIQVFNQLSIFHSPQNSGHKSGGSALLQRQDALHRDQARVHQQHNFGRQTGKWGAAAATNSDSGGPSSRKAETAAAAASRGQQDQKRQ